MNEIAPLLVTVYVDAGCSHLPNKVLRERIGSRWCHRCGSYVPCHLLGTLLVTVSETGTLTAQVFPAEIPGEEEKE